MKLILHEVAFWYFVMLPLGALAWVGLYIAYLFTRWMD